MLRQLLLALSCAAFLPACSHIVSAQHRGSGVRATAVRTLPEFTRVEAHGALDLRIRVGEAPGVEVDGDDNLLPLFESEVSRGTLHLGFQRGSFAPRVPLVARVTLRELSAVEISGAIEAGVTGLSRGKLKADLTGASTLRAGGEVDELEVGASGACRLEAFDLTARAVKLDLVGACTAHVRATEALRAEASGASTVRYRGSPTVEASTTGASSIAPE